MFPQVWYEASPARRVAPPGSARAPRERHQPQRYATKPRPDMLGAVPPSNRELARDPAVEHHRRVAAERAHERGHLRRREAEGRHVERAAERVEARERDE